MEVAKIRVLRWMCYVTMLERIWNECIRRILSVENIAGKIRE